MSTQRHSLGHTMMASVGQIFWWCFIPHKLHGRQWYQYNWNSCSSYFPELPLQQNLLLHFLMYSQSPFLHVKERMCSETTVRIAIFYYIMLHQNKLINYLNPLHSLYPTPLIRAESKFYYANIWIVILNSARVNLFPKLLQYRGP